MAESLTIPPARRSDLLLRPLGEDGESVVKDLRTGAYYNLGPQESFLLERLDGEQSAASICQSFEGRRVITGPSPAATPSKKRQSILYWRISIFDPDRLFNWLEPKIRFIWTRTFLIVTAAMILLAALVASANTYELISRFPDMLRWQTWFAAWLVLVFVTTCHEFAHGLTCKHHGGEVHELGFLLMYFMPCFYCNVSDAWLLRRKSQRLWVTLAGAYCDLVMWALAILLWRMSRQDTLLNYLAWVVLSVCGIRIFFNLNPLLKLDGYYLLSDAISIPNLRQRSLESVAGRLRWLLWGAPRPKPEPRDWFLVMFGVASWFYSALILFLLVFWLLRFLGMRWGMLGVACAVLAGLSLARNVFYGLSNGEVTKMFRIRRPRAIAWILTIIALAAVAFIMPVEKRACGKFVLRPAVRAEMRAPVAGFLRAVECEEGGRVEKGSRLATIEVPDLASRIAQKRADVEESDAKLKLLEAGPRLEEIVEERHHVQRLCTWRDLASADLAKSKAALKQELARLDELIRQNQIELHYANEAYRSAKEAIAKAAMSQQEFNDFEKKLRVCEAVLEQNRAERQRCVENGTTLAESELAKREKELADAKGTLALLEAGTRPEEIAAQRAHLNRLREEAKYLEELDSKSPVLAAVGGVMVTPHLAEKIGQYFKEGDLICVIEDPENLRAEIALPEQELLGVAAGQAVELKFPATPYKTLSGQVERIAPTATSGDVGSNVTVYCNLAETPAELRAGLSGYARICCGKRPVALVVGDRVMRSLRTEYWW